MSCCHRAASMPCVRTLLKAEVMSLPRRVALFPSFMGSFCFGGSEHHGKYLSWWGE